MDWVKLTYTVLVCWITASWVASAALTYFDKSLDQLSPAEAAFLAALPKAPNNYNPVRFPDRAKARRDWVLEQMAEEGYVSSAELREEQSRPVSTRLRGETATFEIRIGDQVVVERPTA